MKVLVTGGTGFVGSHVTRQLQRSGHSVRLLVRSESKATSYYDSLGEPVPELMRGDITVADSVRHALDGCSAVVHAAAATPMGTTREQLFAVNVAGTKNVVGTAVALGIGPIVCVSSITAIFNTDGAKVTPDAPPAPSKLPYGQSKVEAEHYLRSLQDRGEAIATVYPGGVVGPDDPTLSDSMKALAHRIDKGFRIFEGGGMQQVDVRDLAAFICALVEQGGAGRFLVPGVYLTWNELADVIETASGCELIRIDAKGWKLRLVGRIVDMVRKFRPVDSPISAETMRYATLWPRIRNSDELDQRGIALRNPKETFGDSIAWLVSQGHLPAEKAPAAVSERG